MRRIPRQKLRRYAAQQDVNSISCLPRRTSIRYASASAYRNAASSSGSHAPSISLGHNQKDRQRFTSALSAPTSFSSTSSPSALEDKDSSLRDRITYFMSQKSTPLSLSTMYKYACSQSFSRLANAQFLHRELQIRIAHRLTEAESFPYGLSQTKAIQQVIKTYEKYLEQFRECPLPKTPGQEYEFTTMLQEFVLDRHSIPSAIYRGLTSLKDSRREALTAEQLNHLELHIQRFIMARVGLRFLTEHHVLSSPDIDVDAFRKQQGYLQCDENENECPLQYKGAISTSCDPVREAERVAAQVMEDCRLSFGISPEIDVIDCCAGSEGDDGRNFTYVPHHLHYMLAELLKNSCRAVVNTHWLHHGQPQGLSRDDTQPIFSALQRSAASLGLSSDSWSSFGDELVPPIRVVVVKGEEDITIKIADRGGGIPRSSSDKIWTFAHSTLEGDETSLLNSEMRHGKITSSTNFDRNAFTNEVHGRSFGLPLAKIYAQYFGGELTIKSMEGFGVDAYLYLPVLGVNCEHLPERVYYSPGNWDSSMDSVASPTGAEEEKNSDGGLTRVWKDDVVSEANSAEALKELSRRAL